MEYVEVEPGLILTRKYSGGSLEVPGDVMSPEDVERVNRFASEKGSGYPLPHRPARRLEMPIDSSPRS